MYSYEVIKIKYKQLQVKNIEIKKELKEKEKTIKELNNKIIYLKNEIKERNKKIQEKNIIIGNLLEKE